MANAKQWFEVDKKGLAALMRRRAGDQGGGELGLAFLMFELLQNAYDEDVTEVIATLHSMDNKRGRAELAVIDDSPDGFRDLRDSWTLFAPSYKASNPNKRGRFNLGEKLVLSLCETAKITSTTGGVEFAEAGRKTLRKKRNHGTAFEAVVKITKKDVERIDSAMRLLIPEVPTIYNGRTLPIPDPICILEKLALPTEFTDDEGEMRRTTRQTDVEVYDPLTEGGGWIYEMGIPVVHTGDKFSVNVLQAVPLGVERDNVTPSYLKKIRTHVLNATAHLLDKEDAAESWVNAATDSDEIEPEAMSKIMDHTHGEKRFIWDPSNPEAGKDLISKGFTPVYGNQLSSGQRANIRVFRENGNDVAPPAGRLSSAGMGAYSNDPLAPAVKQVEPTPDMLRVMKYAKEFARRTMHIDITVKVISSREAGWSACYGERDLHFNLNRVGHKFFNGTSADALHRVNTLLIHEFGHEYCSDHLNGQYHDALCRLGASLSREYLTEGFDPREYGYNI